MSCFYMNENNTKKTVKETFTKVLEKWDFNNKKLYDKIRGSKSESNRFYITSYLLYCLQKKILKGFYFFFFVLFIKVIIK